MLTELAAPPGAPARRSRRPLPPYRHVPGLTPHPVTHPEGHSHGLVEEPLPPDSIELPERWRDCEEYLYGVDLFNRAYLWEAHEAWEAVWHAVGHDSRPGQFLQGLIQASAALLQRHRGRRTGAANLIAKSASRLDRAGPLAGGLYMGLELETWRRALRSYFSGASDAFPFLVLRD